ncbi:hypothetical protein ACFL2G_04690 [Candidatus Omnitrophota bacterium]
MKPFLFSIIVISLISFGNNLLAQEDFTIDSTKGAKINVYSYRRISGTPEREKPIFLVHGFNSNGEVWSKGETSYVRELANNGYDVIVVDMRGNKVDTDGDHIVDEPVPGDSWGYSVKDLGDDVGIALTHGMEYLNNNLPDRNYTKADVITHSAGALAVTAYSRSQGLITYKDNIDTIIELAPPNNGSSKVIANIKEAAKIIPSVFSQTMVAYEHCLDLSSGKVWVPAGRGFESENLRKELIPESIFLKSIKGLGPHPDITAFIGIGSQDLVVDNWSSVIEERDDIGYEYFAEIGHTNFCNDEWVIKALLDKLEKGDESNFFSRYKPYLSKNTIAFLLGPGIGIDHPDDTFDVITFAKGINISPRGLFDLYLRIAGRKQKEALLEYWNALYLFDKAQKEIDEGETEETVIEKWDDILSEKNEILHDSFAEASEEYLQCPDIAILANGYYNELAKFIIEEVREPVRIIDHTFSPSILNEQKVLIIPTGGLSGISNSDIFKKKLSEFVRNGGTLICLSQQYGYDFYSLPTGEVKGYGWQEDALCYRQAAYIETFHQILSSQTELYPDVKLDGYFTSYPENSKIFLRRRKNLMPAMLMYDYGGGKVVVASVYTDWGCTKGQAGAPEISLVRDTIRWSKNSASLPEYKAGSEFRQRIDVNRNFDKIRMILKSPDNDIIEESVSENPVFVLQSLLSQPGIYCVDYILYDSDSEVIQPQTEGFYFSFSQPPEGTVENTSFAFGITTDTENYIKGANATVSFHLTNNTNQDEVIKCKAGSTYGEMEFTESVNVSARTTASFDKEAIVTKTGWVFADFYSSGNVFLGYRERGINVFKSSVDIGMTTDRMQYAPGQKIQIQSYITNNSGISIDLLLVLNIVDPEYNEIYYNTETLRLTSKETVSWDRDFDIPMEVSAGIYKIRLNSFSNSTLAGAASVDIDVPGPLFFTDDDLPNSSEYLEIAMEKAIYKPGEPILAKIIIDAKEEIIKEAILDIRVLSSAGSGDLWGIIKNTEGVPIKGAVINGVYTDDEGQYRLTNLNKGELSLDIHAPGFDKIEQNVNILPGTNNLDFVLSITGYGNLSGTIEDAIGSRVVLEPVDVAGSDACIRDAVVSSEGVFDFRHVPVGTYELSVQPEGIIEELQMDEGGNNIILDKLEQYYSSSTAENGTIKQEIQETEPNNDFDTATEVSPDAIVQGAIYDYGDEDYFKIQVESASQLTLSLSNVPDELTPHIIIHDVAGNWISNTAAFAGEDIEHFLEITVPGEYFIHLKDKYNNCSSQEEYALGISLDSGADQYEPNHDFEHAKEINIRQEVVSTVFPKADQDYFVFNIEEKGILYIGMLEVPAGLRPSMKIYDSLGNIISQKAGSSGEKIAFEAEIREPGQYYLMIKDWYSSFSSFETYSFKSYFINTLDGHEPNNTKEEAVLLSFGQNLFATVSTKGDSDFYKLSIPDAGKIVISLNDVPQNIRPYIKLYREGTDSWINSTAGFAGEDLAMEFEVDVPSNYFIEVLDRYNSETSLLRYRLKVIYVPEEGYVIEEPELFSQTINIPEAMGRKEIEIAIPGFEKCTKYYLQAALSSSNPPINSQVIEKFYVSDLDIPAESVLVPELSIDCSINENAMFYAGEEASFKFRVKNTGTAGGGCDITFGFLDLFSDSLYEFLEPGEEKEINFGFPLPADMEEGVYSAEYIFNGEKHAVEFKILGIKIDVESEFWDNLFRLNIENIGTVTGVTLSAEVRCGSFEDKKDFTLVDAEELVFDIPEVSGQEKIYYGIYFSSGKALYLNSLLIEGEEKPGIQIKVVEASCDKNNYTDGEDITINWKLQSEDTYLLKFMAYLIGPDSSAIEVINEEVYLSEGDNDLEQVISPELLDLGLYRIIYGFCEDESAVLRGSLFFDAGEEVSVELHLDKKLYARNRLMKLTACCFSSSKLHARLGLFLDGKLIRSRRIRLDGYRENNFYIRRKSGQHQAYCVLYCDGEKVNSNVVDFTVSKNKKRKCFKIRRCLFRLFKHLFSAPN